MADGDRKTPIEPAVAEQRRKSDGSLKAVRVPPRPDSALDPDPVLQARGLDGRYRGITPSDSDRPGLDPPKIREDEAAEEKHPRFDRAPPEKTGEVARQGRWETRELRADFSEFKAENAKEHLGITRGQTETNRRLDDVQKALPDAARAGRMLSLITTIVSVIGTVGVAFFGYRMIHEQRLTEQAKASAPAAAHATPSAGTNARK